MDDDKLGEETEGGRKGGVLLLALGIFAGLLIGGGAVYVLIGMNGAKTDQEEGAPAEEADTHAEEPAPEIQLLTVPVRRFSVPLIDADRRILGYMWVDLAFEVDGPENQSYVAARVPELKDAFLRDLNAIQTTRTDRPGALDFELLGARLDAAARRVLGKDRLIAVRITNAVRMPD